MSFSNILQYIGPNLNIIKNLSNNVLLNLNLLSNTILQQNNYIYNKFQNNKLLQIIFIEQTCISIKSTENHMKNDITWIGLNQKVNTYIYIYIILLIVNIYIVHYL